MNIHTNTPPVNPSLEALKAARAASTARGLAKGLSEAAIKAEQAPINEAFNADKDRGKPERRSYYIVQFAALWPVTRLSDKEVAECVGPDAPAPLATPELKAALATSAADRTRKILTAGLALLANGYQPLVADGKQILIEGWSDGKIDAGRFRAMCDIRPGARNIGLRGGDGSPDFDGLLILDNDMHNAEHVQEHVTLATQEFGNTPLHRFGSKGDQSYYRIRFPLGRIRIGYDKEVTTDKGKQTQFVSLIEVLGDGRQGIVFGVHPDTGKPYNWRGKDDFDDPATPLTVPLSALPLVPSLDCIMAYASKAIALCLKQGYEGVFVKRTREGQSKAAADVNEDHPVNIDRGRRRLRDLVAAGRVSIQDMHGDDRLYEIACEQVRDLYLSPPTAADLIEAEYNPHCEPPWTTQEIEAKCESAFNNGQNERGARALSGTVIEIFREALDKLPKDAPEAENIGGWPEPTDLFAERDYKKDAKITRDMLPDAIADFAFDTAECLGVSPAMVAVPCLAVAAASLHDAIKVQPKKHDTRYQVRACTWGAMIADPGVGKSPAMKEATGIFNTIEGQWDEEDTKAFAKFKQDQDRHAVAIKANLKSKSDTVIIGEKLPDEPILLEPEKPKKRAIIIDNATMEGLYKPLLDNPRGMLVVKEELKEWIESFDAYSVRAGKDRAAALRLRDGGRLKVTRAADDRNFDIPNWSASVIGGIQGDVLKGMVKKLDMSSDGFLQRFQPFFGEKTYEEQDRLPNYAAKNQYENLIRRLVTLEPTKPRRAVVLSAEARPYWDKVVALANHVSRADENISALRNHASKWGGMFAEHLLNFHAIECMDAGERLHPEISGQTAARAYALMTGFFVPQALQFYDTFFSTGSVAFGHAQWLAGYILSYHLDPSRKHQPLTEVRERDLKRAYGEVRDDRALLLNAMEHLTDAGWVGSPEEKSSPHGGPASIRWRVNPLVHVRFKDSAAREYRERKKRRTAAAGGERASGTGQTP